MAQNELFLIFLKIEELALTGYVLKRICMSGKIPVWLKFESNALIQSDHSNFQIQISCEPFDRYFYFCMVVEENEYTFVVISMLHFLFCYVSSAFLFQRIVICSIIHFGRSFRKSIETIFIYQSINDSDNKKFSCQRPCNYILEIKSI